MESVYEKSPNVNKLVGTRELSRLLGISAPAVTKAYKEGRITPSGYDNNNNPLYDPAIVPREWASNTKRHSTNTATLNIAARIAEHIAPEKPLPAMEPKIYTSPRPPRPAAIDGEKDDITFDEVDEVLDYLQGCINTRRMDHREYLKKKYPNFDFDFEDTFPSWYDLIKNRVVELTRAALDGQDPQAVLFTILELYHALEVHIFLNAQEAPADLMDTTAPEDYTFEN